MDSGSYPIISYISTFSFPDIAIIIARVLIFVNIVLIGMWIGCILKKDKKSETPLILEDKGIFSCRN